MKIYFDTLNSLLSRMKNPPPEMGGILGGYSGIVTTYSLDEGIKEFDNYGHYYPDVKKINKVIGDWMRQGISFFGMFHSHFPGGYQLSSGDKKFINQIMLAMPLELDKLFFPVIVSAEIIVYQAVRYESQIYICRDEIEII